jgi:hypothetical protein
MRFVLGLQLFVATISAIALKAPTIAEDLKKLVASSPVTVEYKARWSDYNLPFPSVVVNATSEKDVAAVVCFLI